MSRYFNFGLLLVGLTEKSVYGYDTGEDITLCWVWQPNDLQGSNTSARSNFKSYAPVREECGDFDVVVVWPAAMFESTRVSFETTFYTPLLSPPAYAPPAEEAPVFADVNRNQECGDWFNVVHANIHSCERNVGFCTPFIPDTPSLSTHSATLHGCTDAQGTAHFVSEASFATGVYTIISHVSYYDTAGRRHDASRAYFADVLKKETADYRELVISFACIFAFFFLVGLVWFGRAVLHWRRAAKQASAARLTETRRRILGAKQLVYDLKFSVCYIKLSSLKARGTLVHHEHARDHGLLRQLDTFDQLIAFNAANKTIFISHQWVAIDHPDPDNAQYKAILTAVAELCKEHPELGEDPWIWLDYICVPQLNRHMQLLSISSLAVYSGQSSHFLVICPKLKHRDTHLECSLSSYMARGWCRLEMLAHILSRVGRISTLNMYIFEDELERFPSVVAQLSAPLEAVAPEPLTALASIRRKLSNSTQEASRERKTRPPPPPPPSRSQPPERLKIGDALFVFDGDFTVASDKEKLVDTVLSLYIALLQHRGCNDAADQTLARIGQMKDRFLPPELFGNLVEAVEANMDEYAPKVLTLEQFGGMTFGARLAAGCDDRGSLDSLKRGVDGEPPAGSTQGVSRYSVEESHTRGAHYEGSGSIAELTQMHHQKVTFDAETARSCAAGSHTANGFHTV